MRRRSKRVCGTGDLVAWEQEIERLGGSEAGGGRDGERNGMWDRRGGKMK